MASPRFQLARGFKSVIHNATITLNSTTWAEVAAATGGPGTGVFDLTLAAQAGDVVEVGFVGTWGVEDVTGYLDIYTLVGPTSINSIGKQGAIPGTSTGDGIRGWQGSTGVATDLISLTPGGSMLYPLVIGDINANAVRLRPVYRTSSASNKTLVAGANSLMQFWAKNLGPADIN